MIYMSEEPTSYKRFSKELYDKYDNEGRRVAKLVFEQLFDYEVREPEGENARYDTDYVLYYNGKFFAYLEVEVKTTWRGRVFPFPTINVPMRKMKFITPNARTIFCLVNESSTHCLIIDGMDVYHAQKQEVPNKYMEREVFKQVALNKAVIIKVPKAEDEIKPDNT